MRFSGPVCGRSPGEITADGSLLCTQKTPERVRGRISCKAAFELLDRQRNIFDLNRSFLFVPVGQDDDVSLGGAGGPDTAGPDTFPDAFDFAGHGDPVLADVFDTCGIQVAAAMMNPDGSSGFDIFQERFGQRDLPGFAVFREVFDSGGDDVTVRKVGKILLCPGDNAVIGGFFEFGSVFDNQNGITFFGIGDDFGLGIDQSGAIDAVDGTAVFVVNQTFPFWSIWRNWGGKHPSIPINATV